jgi:hypothetical protein
MNCGHWSGRCCRNLRRSRSRDGLGFRTGRLCAGSCSCCTSAASGSTCRKFSDPSRPTAMHGAVPVSDAQQGLAHGRHAFVPAVLELRAPRGRHHAWLHTRAAALSLRRLINLGLTRAGNIWMLSPATTWAEEPPGPRLEALSKSCSSSIPSVPGADGSRPRAAPIDRTARRRRRACAGRVSKWSGPLGCGLHLCA